MAANNDEGQSVLEFLLMLPMMVGLVVILVRINTAIQISIVDQQYARAQTLTLAYNNPVFPLLRLREPHLTAIGYNQMVLGVSDNPANNDEGHYTPKAATFYIARTKGKPSGEDQAQPNERALVRIRNTVTLCTQPNVMAKGGGPAPILELKNAGSEASPVYVAVNNYQLGENPKQFDYCGSPMKYTITPEGGP
jgi:hypothetical protein